MCATQTLSTNYLCRLLSTNVTLWITMEQDPRLTQDFGGAATELMSLALSQQIMIDLQKLTNSVQA